MPQSKHIIFARKAGKVLRMAADYLLAVVRKQTYASVQQVDDTADGKQLLIRMRTLCTQAALHHKDAVYFGIEHVGLLFRPVVTTNADACARTVCRVCGRKRYIPYIVPQEEDQ
jgi:hypothetical protein